VHATRKETEIMPWRDFFKRKTRRPDEPDEVPEQPEVVGRPPQGRRGQVDLSDPATRERRRTRLERRVKDLTLDIQKAETALAEQNRWSERVAEIDEAIEQAHLDADAILKPAHPHEPVELAASPVVIEQVHPGRAAEVRHEVGEELIPGDPADIRFTVGDVAFRYTDEIDWSERGHTRSETQLRRVEGDINHLIPGKVPEDRREELHEHLAHSLSTFAEHLQMNAFENRPQPSMTLAKLAHPCPVCGGWQDWKGRCPSCQRRQWEAQHIRAEIDRLIAERDQQEEEAQSWRERLPILRRQLAEAQKEYEKYVDEA
jgi:hypothetical protein